MQDVQDISSIFGPKYSAMALAIGESPDNVRKWIKHKRIPETAWQALVQAATDRGVSLSVEDILRANRPLKPRPGRPRGKVVRLKRRTKRARAIA